MNSWLIISVLGIYLVWLFFCALFGEKYTNKLGYKGRIALFSLTLGVYCTSWTFYGASSTISNDNVLFTALFLGPLLFVAIGYDFWRRIGRVRQHHAISSIADFVAARYGKSSSLAGIVALLSFLAITPYLALQLRAIDLTSQVLLSQSTHFSEISSFDFVFGLSIILVILAMVFATRQIANTEQHGGLMLAIAFESILKLLALMTLAFVLLILSPEYFSFAVQDLKDSFTDIQLFGVPATFWTQTLLATLAIICLPRQFHVAVVELGDKQYLKGARIWFTLYLILTVIAIIPISSWILHQTGISPREVSILFLPLQLQQDWLSALTFLGGFSAAIGMLLISSITLATMLSNDLIIPALWRFNLLSRNHPYLSRYLRSVRLSCILIVMSAGFLCYMFIGQTQRLTDLGLLAFSAVAQFAPILLGGLYWRGGSKQGVWAGLFVGFSLWTYTLLLPTIFKILPDHVFWAKQFLIKGLFDIQWLRPEALFGFSSLPPLTHGVVWSLTLNLLTYIWVSKLYRPSIAEQIQAESFFFFKPRTALAQPHHGVHHSLNNPSLLHPEMPQEAIHLKVKDLFELSQRITGYEPTRQAFLNFCEQNQLSFDRNSTANGMWWRFTEQYLASAIGTASARTLLTSAMVNNGLALGQVANLLDQTSRWQRFNRNLLMTMLDNMTLGVSVVDENMCLIAWNEHYLELFGYPKSLVYVGCPISELIRYNAERGECGEGEIEEHIRKRIHWMQQGSNHEFERIRKDGRIIQMRGVPIEGGGFVTTFADITAFRKQEAILESKVQERTQELAKALNEQKIAREQADIANMAKSRFIAAASHDLLQPMHAARLFSTALEQSVHDDENKQTLAQLDRALHGAESMLSALLDIARLESGTLQPKRQAFALHDLLSDLQLQFHSIAQQRGITLKVHQNQFWIDTDPQWIRRIVQNFVSNALRYTAKGKVIVGVLRAAHSENHIRIGVWDTGFGISEQQKQKLFLEFERGGHVSPWGEQGLGLGLAIVQRMTQLLNYPLYVYSEQNKGSCFMIEVPLCPAPQQQEVVNTPTLVKGKSYRILCLDNDETILAGMKMLLSKWGHEVFATTSTEQALAFQQEQDIDIWLIDQHLNHEQMGLDFVLAHRPENTPIALITADSDPDLPQKLKALDLVLMKKPLKPAHLRAWLNSLRLTK